MAVQLAPKGDRIYMLGGFNRLIIWALDPGDASGPIKRTGSSPQKVCRTG